MGMCISACVQLLTRVHDERTLRKTQHQDDLRGDSLELAPAEKQPSVMLVFSIIERQKNQNKTINFLRKVFLKDLGLIHQRNSSGETLLFFSCKQGKLKVVEYLLNFCGNSSEVCTRGSAIHACVHAVAEQFSMSVDEGCKMIAILLDRGCNIESRNWRNWTAFYLAASLGCEQIMRLLARRGCDVTVTCDDGLTALHAAVTSGNPKAVHIIQEMPSININAIDRFKRSALHIALMSMLRPNYFSNLHNVPIEYRDKFFERQASIVESLLHNRCDTNVRHIDNTFRVPTSSTSGERLQANNPLTLSLVIYFTAKEECQRAYITARREAANNPGPHLALPIPALQYLDSANKIRGLAVAIVIQMIMYGARAEDVGFDLLPELQEVLTSQQAEDVTSLGELNLQKLCRTCIRINVMMGKNGFEGIRTLPLPTNIVHFLLFGQV